MNKEDIFFKDNEVRLENHSDYKITPELHYISFYSAVGNYFKTVQQMKKTFHFVLGNLKRGRESIGFDFTQNKNEIINSIISFHRFIELHLKFILKNLHPNLVYKTKDRINLWSSYEDSDNFKKEYVDYEEAKKRVLYALRNNVSNDSSQNHISEYQFLLSETSTLCFKHLTKWRNRLTHNGNTLPNIFAYEYLITQLVLPMVNNLLQVEKNLGREIYSIVTYNKINIIEEIINLKLEISDFKDYTIQSVDAKRNFLKIFHLKEMGRSVMNISAFNTSLLISGPIETRVEENKNVSIPEKIAQLEDKDDSKFRDRCNCCGRETKVTYKEKLPLANLFPNDKEYIMWFVCYNCGYYLEDTTLDPCEFNLSEILVFEY